MKCPQCQHMNLEANKFCSNCGGPLESGRDYLAGQGQKSNQEINSLIKETLNKIQKEIQIIQTGALEQFQEKAVHWAKNQMYILGIALLILTTALGIFGYRELAHLKKITDTEINKISEMSEDLQKYQNFLKDNQKEALQIVQKIQNESESLNDEINRQKEGFDEIKSQIEELGIKELQDDIKKFKNLRDTFQKKFKEFEHLESERIEQFQKLKNSYFNLTIHFDGDKDEYKEKFSRVIEKLNAKGFYVRSFVSGISVNKREVIYYNSIAKGQAEQIAQVIHEEYPDITERSLDRIERDSREILIKLKPL